MSTPAERPTEYRGDTSIAAQRSLLPAALAGGALALATLIGYVWWQAGPRMPAVDAAMLAAAREKWQQHGPPSYAITIAVSGSQRAKYRVVVREGRVVSAKRNGTPLTDRRTLGVWSVPGMFDTMEIDVRHATEPIRIDAQDVHYVTPLCRFHPTYGYPVRYRRVEWGSDIEAAWEVTEFAVPGQP